MNHELENLRSLLAAEINANDAAIFRIAQLEADLAAIKQQFINYENADEYALDMMLEYANLQSLIMSIKEQQ